MEVAEREQDSGETLALLVQLLKVMWSLQGNSKKTRHWCVGSWNEILLSVQLKNWLGWSGNISNSATLDSAEEGQMFSGIWKDTAVPCVASRNFSTFMCHKK